MQNIQRGEGCELEKVVVAGMYMFSPRHTKRYFERLQQKRCSLPMTADTMRRHLSLTQCIVLLLTPAAVQASSTLLEPPS